MSLIFFLMSLGCMSISRNAHDAMSNLVVEGHNCGPKQPWCMADGGGGAGDRGRCLVRSALLYIHCE